MLFNCDQDKAIEYLSSVIGQVNTFGDILQIIVIELIRKVCKSTASGSDRVHFFSPAPLTRLPQALGSPLT
jgi:hypothetical protein